MLQNTIARLTQELDDVKAQLAEERQGQLDPEADLSATK